MIILSAGHYPESPGACYPEDNPQWCEHAKAVDWLQYIALLLRQQVKVGIVPSSPLKDKVLWVNEQCRRNDVKLAVELHFNSDASKKQSGSETLYCPGSTHGEMLANIVQSELAIVFPPNRGVKEGWYQMDRENGPDYFLSSTNCPALIIEPEFIYNRTTIEANRNIACETIVRALLEAVTHA